MNLRRAQPAEEFSRGGSPVVGAGLGVGREQLRQVQSRSSDALVVRNSQNSPWLSCLTISAARLNRLVSKASLPTAFLIDSRIPASTVSKSAEVTARPSSSLAR